MTYIESGGSPLFTLDFKRLFEYSQAKMSKKRILQKFIIFLFSGFILVATATVSHSKRFTYTPTVDVFTVSTKKKIPVNLIYPARLKSSMDVIIKAQVEGTLIKRFFKDGEFIKKGKVLFQIDPSVYLAKLNQLKAALDSARANLEYEKSNYERIKKSFDENLVSKEKYDYALFNLKSAKAGVKKLEAEVKLAEIYLSYTKPSSPISGFARERKVDVGNFITVGEPLLEIVKIDPIYAEFSVPDSDIALIEANRNRIKPIILIHGEKLTGTIDFIDKKIDKNTQSLKIRAVFKNRNHLLLPNTFARVHLEGAFRKKATLIPQRAVLQTVDGAVVYLVIKNRVVPKPVKIVGEYKNYFLVKGLKEGDTIAVDNLLKLRPNMKVIVGKPVNDF